MTAAITASERHLRLNDIIESPSVEEFEPSVYKSDNQPWFPSPAIGAKGGEWFCRGARTSLCIAFVGKLTSSARKPAGLCGGRAGCGTSDRWRYSSRSLIDAHRTVIFTDAVVNDRPAAGKRCLAYTQPRCRRCGVFLMRGKGGRAERFVQGQPRVGDSLFRACPASGPI